jgi:serine/threonine protein kinase
MAKILAGLSFIHQNGFFVGCIKSQNILLRKSGPKKVDNVTMELKIDLNGIIQHNNLLLVQMEYLAPETYLAPEK